MVASVSVIDDKVTFVINILAETLVGDRPLTMCLRLKMVRE